jgi:molecular chaperone DnaK
MAEPMQHHPAPWRVALDFGTAWSKAAIAPARNPQAGVRPLRLDDATDWDNPLLLASAVFISKTHVRLGRSALTAALEAPDREALRSFKSILAAPDLDKALEIAPKRTIDPDGVFTFRDLITLYLGYAWVNLENGLATDSERPPLDQCSLAFTLPRWPSAGGAAGLVHQLIVAGMHVGKTLGKAMCAPGGIEISLAKSALASAARPGTPPLRVEGCILEATAAALCHLDGKARFVCVLDMGAGTTDFAGLAIGKDGSISEIPTARSTLTKAGDVLDSVVLGAIVKASGARGTQAQSAVWRAAAGQIRRHKETILSQKKAALRIGQNVIAVPQAQIWKAPDAKSFLEEIDRAFRASLEACAQAAAAAGEKSVTVVAAGGGARLEPIADLLAKPKTKTRNISVLTTPPTPSWANSARFAGQLAPVFPQLAVAMGAALAPPSLVMPLQG